MGSLLVRATFGEMEAGRFVLRSGKRSSENGFQTTFGLSGKGSSLRKTKCLCGNLGDFGEFCKGLRWLRRKRFDGGYAGRCRAGWLLLRGVRAWRGHEGKILGVGLLRGRQPENEIQAVIKFSL